MINPNNPIYPFPLGVWWRGREEREHQENVHWPSGHAGQLPERHAVGTGPPAPGRGVYWPDPAGMCASRAVRVIRVILCVNQCFDVCMLPGSCVLHVRDIYIYIYIYICFVKFIIKTICIWCIIHRYLWKWPKVSSCICWWDTLTTEWRFKSVLSMWTNPPRHVYIHHHRRAQMMRRPLWTKRWIISNYR